MTTAQAVVSIWFCVSVAVSVASNAVFYVWLRARGAGVRLAWAGVPGHLDRKYAEWCGARDVSPRRVLLLRRLELLNLVLAILFAIPLLAGGR